MESSEVESKPSPGWAADPRLKLATVLIVSFINLIYYADRFGISGILAEIQCVFDLNDGQAGFLQAAFVIPYFIFAPITGYLGDRFSRKWIMFSGILLWSVAALGASFVQEFWAFVTLRAVLGIGEACYSSLSPAIISDLYPKEVRSKYLAMYYFTIPVGSGLGYVVFAAVSDAADNWRWGLRVTPILGFVAVLLILFLLLDPPRGQSDGNRMKSTSVLDDMKYLFTHWGFVNNCIASTAVAFVSGAFGAWGPKFITLGLVTQGAIQGDESNDTLGRVSLVFGVITVITGLMGVILGALMGAKLRPKFPRADPIICGFGVLAGVPFIYAMTLLADGPVAPTYVTFFFGAFLVNLNWSLTTEMLMYTLVPTRRASAKSIQIALNHFLGDAGSPFIIGLISDAIKPLVDSPTSTRMTAVPYADEEECQVTSINVETAQRDFTALQYSLFVSLIIQAIGALAYVAISWTIVEDRAAATAASQRLEASSSSVGSNTDHPSTGDAVIESSSVPPFAVQQDGPIVGLRYEKRTA